MLTLEDMLHNLLRIDVMFCTSSCSTYSPSKSSSSSPSLLEDNHRNRSPTSQPFSTTSRPYNPDSPHIPSTPSSTIAQPSLHSHSMTTSRSYNNKTYSCSPGMESSNGNLNGGSLKKLYVSCPTTSHYEYHHEYLSQS